MKELEALLDSITLHARRLQTDTPNQPVVKAAKDIQGVAEGLRIVVRRVSHQIIIL